jgi:hypothetical protein
MKNSNYFAYVLLFLLVLNPGCSDERKMLTVGEGEATGYVYYDENGNQRFDSDEEGLSDIAVSNGREIVLTNEYGQYILPYTERTIFFVIKPSGWTTAFDENFLPKFYYIHQPAGSPGYQYAGIDSTGELPEMIDFPLYRQREPGEFKAILFADPQPRDQHEINYIAHDVVEELVGMDASFGVTLGDILFDDLSLFHSINQTIGLIGIPWYNVLGNHDINFDSPDDYGSNETFKSVYGPPYYSFNYGEVHFLVLDDVDWLGAAPAGPGRYRGGLDRDQLEFITKDLSLIPENQLIVLLMHIPLNEVGNRQELYRLIEKRPFCISISGHTHYQKHLFITKEDGWQGPQPHHHVINVTVSGSWWEGAFDERGIPHTTMRDGAPNGYSIISFDGTKYDITYKAASQPSDYQLSIFAPEEIDRAALDSTKVIANVFAGSERSGVDMQVDDGDWVAMNRVTQKDPNFLALKALEASETPPTGRKLPEAIDTNHIWEAYLPGNLDSGLHIITVKTVDMFGKTYSDKRALRVN